MAKKKGKSLSRRNLESEVILTVEHYIRVIGKRDWSERRLVVVSDTPAN